MSSVHIWELVIAGILASCGGLAHRLYVKDVKACSMLSILSEVFVSGFSGVMVAMLARSYGISGDLLGVASGMAGWMGPKILFLLERKVSEVLRLGGRKDETP